MFDNVIFGQRATPSNRDAVTVTVDYRLEELIDDPVDARTMVAGNSFQRCSASKRRGEKR
jgi:hypothetical protein